MLRRIVALPTVARLDANRIRRFKKKITPDHASTIGRGGIGSLPYLQERCALRDRKMRVGTLTILGRLTQYEVARRGAVNGFCLADDVRAKAGFIQVPVRSIDFALMHSRPVWATDSFCFNRYGTHERPAKLGGNKRTSCRHRRHAKLGGRRYHWKFSAKTFFVRRQP